MNAALKITNREVDGRIALGEETSVSDNLWGYCRSRPLVYLYFAARGILMWAERVKAGVDANTSMRR
jgi:hypothetical protein